MIRGRPPGRTAWADDLPRIKAANEAWRVEHLPRLRLRQKMLDERRELATQTLREGLNAINATSEQRNAVFAATGISA